jgi:hypothetical protein
MNEPSPQRPQFTLKQLLVAVTVIAAVLGLGVRWILQAREESRQTQCRNNLKVLGLAVHNYHDAYNSLPPLATDPDCWTWQTLLWPFCESSRFYSSLNLNQAAHTPQNIAQIVPVRPRTLLCPARGQSRRRESGTYAGAQPSDYCAVSTSDSLEWSPLSDGMLVYREDLATTPADPIGPPGKRPWRSATTFTSVTDGLMYTLMIGEKHMRPEWIGGQYDEPGFVAIEDPNTIRVATDRLGGKGLARSQEDDDPWKFGSWHTGVTLFSLGDGAVRPFSNKTGPAVLRLLSCRNDGQTVEIP